MATAWDLEMSPPVAHHPQFFLRSNSPLLQPSLHFSCPHDLEAGTERWVRDSQRGSGTQPQPEEGATGAERIRQSLFLLLPHTLSPGFFEGS